MPPKRKAPKAQKVRKSQKVKARAPRAVTKRGTKPRTNQVPEFEDAIEAQEAWGELEKRFQDLSGQIGAPFRTYPDDFRRLINNFARESTVFAAVRAIGHAACSVPWILDKRVSKTEWEEVEDIDDPTMQLLMFPNEMMGWCEWVDLDFQFKEVAGNSYYQVTPAGQINSPGLATAHTREAEHSLIPLWPHLVSPKFDPQKGITKYEYKATEGPVEYDPSEIIHFQYRTPVNSMIGYPPAMASDLDARMVFFGTDWNLKFFANGAMPPLAIKTPYAQSEAQRHQWMGRYRAKTARKKWHEPLLLEEGESVENIGKSQKDMEFATTIDKGRIKILSAHGVPPSFAGFPISGYGSMREQSKQFWAITMLPKLRIFAAQINAQLIPKGYRFRFDFTDIMPLIKEYTENVTAEVALVNAGIKTRNEVREELGYPKGLPWGDDQPPSAGGSSGARGEGAPPPQTVKSEEDGEPEPVMQQGEDGTVKVYGCSFLQKYGAQHLGSIEMCKQERGRDLKDMRRVVGRYLEDFASRVSRRVLRGEIGEVPEETISKAKPKQGELTPEERTISDRLVDIDEEFRREQDKLLKQLARTFTRHANMAAIGAGLDVKFGTTDPIVVDRARESAGKMIEQVSNAVKAEVGRRVAEGIRAGTPRRVLARDIEQIVKDPSRAARIADTEVLSAVQTGRQTAYEEGGAFAKRWVPIIDSATRQPGSQWTGFGKYPGMTEDHAIMATDIVRAVKRVDEQFEVPSRGNDRELMMHPGDPGAPADAVVNCRCISEVIFEDEYEALTTGA